MRADVKRSAVAVGVLLLVGLSGCAGTDTAAVPTEAGGAFVCDGVPSRGAELILGGAVVETRHHGQWGLDARGFQCAVTRESGGSGLITIEEWDVGTRLGTDSEGALELIAGQAGATPIDAQVDGAGYVSGAKDEGSATWVCGARMLAVDLQSVTTAGRDQRADAEALLVSMLPWACGDAEAPPRTVED